MFTNECGSEESVLWPIVSSAADRAKSTVFSAMVQVSMEATLISHALTVGEQVGSAARNVVVQEDDNIRSNGIL